MQVAQLNLQSCLKTHPQDKNENTDGQDQEVSKDEKINRRDLRIAVSRSTKV